MPFSLDEIRLSCRCILLRNLIIPCAIGAYPHEHGKLQRVALEADVWVRRNCEPLSDNLSAVLNYDLIVDIVRTEATRGHVELQESLVEHIAECIIELAGVELVRVQSTKLDAYPDADIGIEIWRNKSNHRSEET